MKRKKPGAHENHERWLVSYADFITLLFAFFVVMYASSQADKVKAAQVSQSVRNAFERPLVAALRGAKVNGKMKAPEGTEKMAGQGAGTFSELLPSMNFLEKELRKEIEAGKMQVRLEARGLVVSLREAAFFPSGEETILPAAYPSLAKVAEAIGQLPNPVRLEGHTDSVPIHNDRFRSNWELSSHRSVSMLEYFTGRMKLPPTRFAVAGYADTIPVASNDTEDGRARNRRVDIVILSKAGFSGEPVTK